MYIEHSELTMKTEALFGLFKKYELNGFHRSKGCKALRKLLAKFRDYHSTEPTLSERDLRRIGVLTEEVLENDPAFKDAPILVTTRKERDSINMRAGRNWARNHGIPVFWWFQRPYKTAANSLEADQIAESISQFCPGVRGYYIPGASCMLKSNTLPPEGYANGSQGRMIDIVFDDDYVLPCGKPGEMIMIPPPTYLIMEVHHKGKKKYTSILPCQKQRSEIEYYRDRKECVYVCWSNTVVLTFALTVHEVQGQTLKRVILLLGRLPGMNVGKIDWHLLYVALSRTRRLCDMKLYPTGNTDFYHPMYYAHLLRLRMPSKLKKWYKSYDNHCWNKRILQDEHLQQVKEVEKELTNLGKKKLMGLGWDKLFTLAKKLGYKVTTRDRKRGLCLKLCEHMVKRSLWKEVYNRERSKKRKFTDTEDSRVEIGSKPGLRRSKRLRRSQPSLVKQLQKKRGISKLLTTSIPKEADTLRRAKKKRSTKKPSTSTGSVLVTPLHQVDNIRFKGLHNLGQTCYFNSLVQCLLHSPLFRDTIERVPQPALSVDVLRELRLLFKRMTSNNSQEHLSPSRCFSAAIRIPECQEAGMSKTRQEDAGEFFLRLIEHFREKFQPLYDVFEGYLQSTHTCQRCSHSSTNIHPFTLLSLSFPATSYYHNQYNTSRTHDIYNLLDDFVTPEIIFDYRCDYCPVQNPTEKNLRIYSTPKILVLQLGRFSGLNKIDEYVRFPSQLRLNYGSADNSEYQLYRITGVIVHEGPNIESGHYISYFAVGDNWIKANDSSVQEVPWDIVRKEKIYLMFYVRL